MNRPSAGISLDSLRKYWIAVHNKSEQYIIFIHERIHHVEGYLFHNLHEKCTYCTYVQILSWTNLVQTAALLKSFICLVIKPQPEKIKIDLNNMKAV